MQTDAELDRIRQRQDDRMIDKRWEREDEETRQREEEEVRQAERIDDAISEVSDVQLCLRKGNLDYMAAAGVLIEYLPEILAALLAQQSP